MNLLFKISEDLNIPKELLEEALLYSRKYVKIIKILKKSGGFRYIYQPSIKLKVIQYWLIKNVFCKMKVHECAMAYKHGYSVKDNAKKHSSNRYILKLDFENYFPSISYKDFMPLLTSWHKESKPEWTLDKNAKEVIRKSCFYKDDKLPIGYPSSPIISNILMFNYDTKIMEDIKANVNNYGHTTYTRYADDMIFSTNKKGACIEIHKAVENILASLGSPTLKLNKDKIMYVSTSGGSAIVTGLRLCYDGHLTLHRAYKDKVRLLTSLLSKGILKDEDVIKLKGHISHIKYVDPVFYTKLQNKYFKVLKSIE